MDVNNVKATRKTTVAELDDAVGEMVLVKLEEGVELAALEEIGAVHDKSGLPSRILTLHSVTRQQRRTVVLPVTYDVEVLTG